MNEMNKSKLHLEIHNGILYFKSGDIDEHVLQITIENLIDEYAESLVKKLNLQSVIAMLPSDEEIKQHMTTEHYSHDKGRYRKIRLDRIQGGKMIRDLVKQRIEGNLL